MKAKAIRCLLAVCLLNLASPGHAEDIDLFLGDPPVDTGDLPNVLILLDNTANWNTAFENEKAALVEVFAGLPAGKFNVGLMTFGDPAVGAIRAAIRPMTEENKGLYGQLVNSLEVSGDRANARTLARNISESHRYLKGMQSVDPSKVASGNNSDRDYAGNSSGSAAHQAVHALAGNALAGPDATVYQSPLSPESCADTFVIYIGNTVSSGNVTKDNSSRNSLAGQELQAAGGNTSQIPLSYTSHQDNYADEWARFMKEDMGVTFYTVDVDPTPMPGGHNRGMGNSALLESMANVSGGKYFRVDSSADGGEQIRIALEEIFSEIQSVNTVFASVALPASATTESTFLNQVFIGMFRPDAGRKPRWFGNIKQYQLGMVGQQLRLLDADESPAINLATGFITECARSFWTPSTPDSYWASPLTALGNCIGANSVSNSPDGPIVEKGGQAYTLRKEPPTRTVYTCDSSTGVSCAPASGALVVYGQAGSNSGNNLVNWMVGQDVDNEDGRATTSMRASVHGDVIHSRPVAVNYGTDEEPQVVVFYGANDGLFRAINGSKTTRVGEVVPPGHEIWSFLPMEFDVSMQNRLRSNDELIKFPATAASSPDTGTLKDYGMDGPVVAFTGTVDGVPRKFVYATMRRGGRAIYAFDVSDIESPTLLWRAGCGADLGSSTCTDAAWSNLGQTWSAPSVTYQSGFVDEGDPPALSPLLIMGGGYDTCEDYDDDTGANHNCTASSKGNSIYVVDGVTGANLRTFPTERAVPGAITVVPISSTDRRMKFAYGADTGGNVYRISGPVDGAGVASPVGSTPPSDWEITTIAALGCSGIAGCSNPRKFLFGPDVVEPTDADGKLFILLGSGDREKPLLAYGGATSVTNFAFALTDDPADGAWLDDVDGTCGADVICMAALTPVTLGSGPGLNAAVGPKGWKLELSDDEQVVSSALTVSNVVNFSTHIPKSPEPGSCEGNLGAATTYNIDYRYGSGNAIPITGGGLVPSPVAGKVLIDGEEKPFCIGCGAGGSPLESGDQSATLDFVQPIGRVYMKVHK